jgi:predicted RNA-binding Zn-ribbon protein involved in translation (DUF1610 family)
MALQIPDNMDDLVYFTRRVVEDTGKVMMWIPRGICPACGKAKMGKPKGKEGKAKIRAKEYVCPSCEHMIPKDEYEETLTAEVIYTCPHCGKSGEHVGPYKRKSIQGVKTFRFPCGSCGGDIDVTKKMKAKKEKKKK